LLRKWKKKEGKKETIPLNNSLAREKSRGILRA
jgi:hypothetical protein